MRTKIYSYLIIGVSGAILYLVVGDSPQLDLVLLVSFAALSIATEFLSYRLPGGGSTSLAFAVYLAAVLLGGPITGVFVAAVGSLSADIYSGKPLYRMLFNVAQLAISAAAAGTVYQQFGGKALYFAATPTIGPWVWLAVATMTAMILAGVNIALVSGVLVLSTGRPIRSVFSDLLGYAKGLPLAAMLGIVIAQLVAIAGLPFLLLLLAPFLIARQTFMIYERQQLAYMDTVRSLVVALEATDPYTSGHTQRVATYARSLGKQMGLTDTELRRVEWAAMLHDIGKIALKSETLCKPGTLTEDEYSEVKKHPQVAAAILGEVDFLGDIAPLVASHHERIDGKGYPLGLAGEEIPLGARIITVADAFDAMTSHRPYRSTSSVDEATLELRKAAEGHLDPRCVEHFIAALNEGTIDPSQSTADGESNA